MRAGDFGLPKGTKIYVDMDGVLCDFFAEYAKLAGVESGNYRDIPPAKADPTLDKMIGTDFFARLPKFPTADKLLNIVVDAAGSYNICSSPLRNDHKNSEYHKKVWIRENLDLQPQEVIITPKKSKYAVNADGTPNILIDDRGTNIREWEAAGGVGIKYQADEDSLKVVLDGLKRARRVNTQEASTYDYETKSWNPPLRPLTPEEADKIYDFVKSYPDYADEDYNLFKHLDNIDKEFPDTEWYDIHSDAENFQHKYQNKYWEDGEDATVEYILTRLDDIISGGGISVEEGWKDWAKAGALGTALAVGGAGMLQKGDDKVPTAVVQPAQQQQQQAAKKIQVPANYVVQKITSNPLEGVLIKTARAGGLEGAELAQFMAQCKEETHDFIHMKEKGGKLDFKKYDPRHAPKKAAALGNKKAGDGARYAGKGFLMLTGRYNYKIAGEALGIPLEQHPELLEKPEVAAKVAVWYWKNRVASKVDDFTNTALVTKYINPGMHQLERREAEFAEYVKNMIPGHKSPVKESSSAATSNAGSIASFAKTGGGANVGTFFGGSYQQPNNPFRKKKPATKKHESIFRR